jgi:MFS family permease
MSTRAPHPFHYTLLIVPFGAIGGFVTVALGFTGTQQGLGAEDAAMLTAVSMLPHTWKFLWGPVADTTLSRRTWYLISVLLCAIGVLAMSVIPLKVENLPLLQVVIFTANLASTTLGMAVEGIMAHLTPEDARGRAGGWFQAGNLGGSGMGGGLGLWLLQHFGGAPAEGATAAAGAVASEAGRPWIAGAVLAAAFLLCLLPLYRLPDVPRDGREGGLGQAIVGVARELWDMVRSRSGAFAAVLCFLPISTGAALGVLAQAEVAGTWGAGAEEVGTVNGFLSGILMAFGSLAGGELCARWDARKVYAAIGALMAVVAIGMAVSPLTAAMFVTWGLLYSFCTGLAYAAFTGFVLQVIGRSAAATKYNIFAALSNTPITYMGLVLAWAMTKWDALGMLWVEAGAGLVGLGILGVAAVLLRERGAAGMKAA